MRVNRLVLAVALAALPVLAQDSVAVQLEKGMYAQQTTGDLDAAIQIFRQIVASSPADRIYAAKAQMHLAQALLQKGDLNGAATEYNILAANYSEFHDIVGRMARTMATVNHERVFSRGIVTISRGEPDRFEHTVTHVALTAPPNWRLEGSAGSSDGGDMATFSTSNFKAGTLAVWMKADDAKGSDIAATLQGYLRNKIRTNPQSWPDWTVRPESVQSRVVSGQQALGAVADYTEDGQKKVEYLIWVRSAKNHVLFLGHAAPEDLGALQQGLDQLASTSVIP